MMTTWTLDRGRPAGSVRAAALLVLLVALTLGGCASTAPRESGPPPVPDGMMTMDELASALGYRIERWAPEVALIENGDHRVLLMTAPDTVVRLDGEPVRVSSMPTTDAWDRLLVPDELAAELRPVLARARPRPLSSTGRNAGRSMVPRRMTGVVMIDPGHGGRHPGAPNAHGPVEKVIALDTANRVATQLRNKGLTVVMTRNADRYVSLDDRIAHANRVNPDLFVSIHADGADNKLANGWGVFLARKPSSASIRAASRMGEALAKSPAKSRGIRRANFRVIAETTGPSILVELGFLSNALEAKRLSQASHREAMATAVATGVLDYLARSTP